MQKNNVIIYILATFVIILLFKLKFLASIAELCVNNEPDDIQGYNQSLEMINNTGLIHTGNIVLDSENYTERYDSHAITFDGYEQIHILNPGNYTCSKLFNELIILYNTTGTVLELNQQEMFFVRGWRYYWCNGDNSFLITTGLNINYFNWYRNTYFDCRMVEIPSTTTTAESTTTIDSVTTTIATTTTLKQTFFEKEYTLKEISASFGTIILLFILYYFIFEKGPKKGLIKK